MCFTPRSCVRAYRRGMSDLPFGFGPSDPDDNRRSGSGSGAGGAGGPMGPFGFGLPGGGAGPGGAGGFDMGQLGQMLTQLGQMLSQSQAGAGQGPVNYQLAQQMAHQQLGADGSREPTSEQRRAVE